ncbi:hypothetical protein [Bradyrhizobium erythrophlei]|jgi:hypothetical protein|uniref:Lectin-like protein BA14k n=1 Tax=Bradyrhizobium erythrophlei TaxID=1437360 RepID=A0A1M5TS06_9BRAD|nr:hypothetical protein [Bradyrhizobium erythrophlei]SHH53440.1 hypothetical protein SAMN05444169_7942 [Bradyrhizobium erythrophlei]
MTKFALLATAAMVLSSALAGPAMAQRVIDNPGRCAHPNANCQNLGPGNPYTSNGDQRRMAYRHGVDRNRAANGNDNTWNNGWHDSWNDNRRHDSGFLPGDAAAGVVGGAIGTAGAIATAPFRNDAYAYDNSGRYDNSGWDTRSYAERNGFVCQPGKWFKGEDGRRHLCR